MTRRITIGLVLFLLGFVAGCASTPEAPGQAAGGGVTLRKDDDVDRVWLAEGFTFNGYDTLYIAEPRVEVSDLNKDEQELVAWAKEFLREELAGQIRARGVFGAVVTREADIKPGGRTLRLENTIIDYKKGGGAARYWAGLYGAGQPVIKVRGQMTDGGRPLFVFETKRSGVSAGAKLVGGFRSDRAIQEEDIRDLAKDFASFIARISKGEKKS